MRGSLVKTTNEDCEVTTSIRNNFECMKTCANNTNAVTVNIVNNFDVVAIFENLNQE